MPPSFLSGLSKCSKGLVTRAQDGLVGVSPLLLHEARLHRPRSRQNPALPPCRSSPEMPHPRSPSPPFPGEAAQPNKSKQGPSVWTRASLESLCTFWSPVSQCVRGKTCSLEESGQTQFWRRARLRGSQFTPGSVPGFPTSPSCLRLVFGKQ